MKTLVYGLFLGAVAACGAPAQEGAGGIPVRVDDGAGRGQCIDGTKDRVWLTLRRPVTTKTQGWFVKDKDVNVIINAQVKTDPQPPKALVFPLSATARFGDVPSGQVSLPIEYTIVSGLALTQSNINYTGLDISLTLIN